SYAATQLATRSLVTSAGHVGQAVPSRVPAASSRLIQALASADPAGVSCRLSSPCAITAGSTSASPRAGPYAAITSSHAAGATEETSSQARSRTPGAADTSSQSSSATSP